MVGVGGDHGTEHGHDRESGTDGGRVAWAAWIWVGSTINSRKPSSRRASRTNDGGKGNSRDRRNRKMWLLQTFGRETEFGFIVQCAVCSVLLVYQTLTVGRWPIRGVDGGTYRRENIRPECFPCNVSDGGRVGRAKQLGKYRANVAASGGSPCV